MNGGKTALMTLLVSCSLVLATFATAQGQKRSSVPGSRSAGARRDDILSRENDIASRELSFRRLENDAKARPRSPRERKLTIDQILDDLKRIQLSSRELRLSSSSEAIDYRQVAKLADDIHKRAKRLKENLVIPDSESDQNGPLQGEASSQQVRESLPVLADLVRRFVTNPLWYNLRVTRIGDLERAKNDIAGVIQLSHDIKKQAAKLK